MEGKRRGRTGAAATSSHHSSLDPNHHANYGMSLKNGRRGSLGFRSHRQGTPSWKKTCSLGALLSDVMSCQGSASTWPSGHQIIVICSWELQIQGRFFVLLKLWIAQSGTFSVKGMCLSLEALPCSMPEKRHVPTPARVQVQTALSVRASPRSRK